MKLERGVAYWTLVAGSAAWVAAVALAPVARANGWWLAEWIYQAFQPICHQMPGRSFVCLKEPFAACHRCFGLYLGFLVGLLVIPHWTWLRSRLEDNPRQIAWFFVPMLIDIALGPFNRAPDRFLTGLIAAFPVAFPVWAAVTELAQRWSRKRKESYGLQ